MVRRKAVPVEKDTSPAAVVLDPVAAGSVPLPKRKPISLPKGWKKASDALDEDIAVRTIFPDFNRATRIGGLPVRRIATIHGPTHGGKAQRLTADVLTPTGWQQIGTLRVGDTVTGRDGKAHRVIGVYPQGKRQLYTVHFSDGCATQCCAEHLWYTTTKNERLRGRYIRGPRPERKRMLSGCDGEGSVKSLAAIARDPAYTHEIPLVEPVHYEGSGELVLDPYLLGLLLGDGGMTGSNVQFHKPEQDLQRVVAALIPRWDDTVPDNDIGIRIRGGATMQALRTLGLAGKRSWEKFIPDAYRYAAPEERLQLLRGLMDTDGYVVRDGERVEFSTSSMEMGRQVVELVRGLGGIATSVERDTHYTKDGDRHEARRSARINIWMPEGVVPVASEKQLAKWERGARIEHIRRCIVAVEPAGEDECICIAVDAADHLYVTDDYIVTHNTAFAFGMIKSFVDGDHIAALVDAEHATGGRFAEELVPDLASRDNFMALRPSNYEETIDAVNEFLLAVKAAKVDRPELRSICVVDSINKLVPSKELEKMRAAGAEELAKGHWGMVRAALNQSWLDSLTPRLAAADCALVLIAQERDDDSDVWGKVDDWKIKGGKAIAFDASLLIRVSKSSPIFEPPSDKKESNIVGFMHRVRVHKNKVGHMDGRHSDCVFHLSNGRFTPPGFDLARDAINVGKQLGLVQAAGSWLTWQKRRWQGETRAAQWLHNNAAQLHELLVEINEASDRSNPNVR